MGVLSSACFRACFFGVDVGSRQLRAVLRRRCDAGLIRLREQNFGFVYLTLLQLS
jgi:hypothetical protein